MSEPIYVVTQMGETVQQELEDQGFRLPDRPEVEPSLPEDVTAMPDDDLMELFTVFVGWNDYASAQAALAMITESEMARELEQAEAKAWRTVEAKASVSAAKAHVNGDRDVIIARAKVEKAKAYKRLVTEIADRYERDGNLLSRELTRRTSQEIRKKRRWD